MVLKQSKVLRTTLNSSRLEATDAPDSHCMAELKDCFLWLPQDYGGGKRQDVAELRFRTTEGASVGGQRMTAQCCTTQTLKQASRSSCSVASMAG
eukprot:406084-Amphidinium_carterae.2